jgi:hypothetical protein
MKLNFWQWLGIIVILLAAIGLYVHNQGVQESVPARSATGPS